MELSKRLLAVASLVTTGSIVADIGTDHAYIPLYLIQEKKAPGAIAMDVNEGPLLRAEEHVRDAGLTEQIRLRRSDGLEQLSPGECDCAVIAGMGGGLMIRILSAHPEITKSLKECILQPQSEIERVRSFLLEEGFVFLQEDMVLDDGKYYMMMKVRPPFSENVDQDPKKQELRRTAAEKKRGTKWNSATESCFWKCAIRCFFLIYRGRKTFMRESSPGLISRRERTSRCGNRSYKMI